MKHIIAAFLSLFVPTLLLAQSAPTGRTVVYKPTDTGSTIEFVIKNLGINTKGSFTGLDGRISFDPKDPGKCLFDVSIAANSVNTDNEMRDSHLKNDTYFDVEKYPRIRLISTAITGDNGRFTFVGKLTIKDKTKDVSFPFIATPSGIDYIFKGSFTINRRDFEVGGGSTIANNCTINLTVLARKSA
jgi:polyisoprenoid-binding protein YceI